MIRSLVFIAIIWCSSIANAANWNVAIESNFGIPGVPFETCRSLVNDAIAEWNSVGANATLTYSTNYNVIIRIAHVNGGDIAWTTGDGKTIYYNWNYASQAFWTPTFFDNSIRHELGHIMLGSYHDPNPVNIMYFTASASIPKRLGPNDKARLIARYGRRGGFVETAQITYGLPGDIPFSFDWNGNNAVKDLIVYRRGNWVIDYNRDGNADHTYILGGLPNDRPVVGDMNRDGKIDIGIFRMENASWHIDLNRDGQPDKLLIYGAPGDYPVMGDYNGDTIGDIGVWRGGNWYIDFNFDGKTDATYKLGVIGDLPVYGDVNRDGKGDLIVYRRGLWLVDWNRDGIVDKQFNWGTEQYRPTMMNWNYDKTGDAVIFKDGKWYPYFDQL